MVSALLDLDTQLCVNEKEDVSEVYYLQSQNGNLFSGEPLSEGELDSDSHTSSEFSPLQADVPREILWCSEALGTSCYDVSVSSSELIQGIRRKIAGSSQPMDRQQQEHYKHTLR